MHTASAKICATYFVTRVSQENSLARLLESGLVGRSQTRRAQSDESDFLRHRLSLPLRSNLAIDSTPAGARPLI